MTLQIGKCPFQRDEVCSVFHLRNQIVLRRRIEELHRNLLVAFQNLMPGIKLPYFEEMLVKLKYMSNNDALTNGQRRKEECTNENE